MKTIFGTILFFFLCVFLYTKFLGPFPFAVNSVTTTQQDLFQVTGEGSATATPDIAHIAFGITKSASNVNDAQNLTNNTMNSILDALKTLGISAKDIKTTDYTLTPNYDFTSGSQTITGYTVTQSIDLKIQPLDKVNTALDTLTAHGANLIGQVSFGFSDQTEQKLEDQARSDAVNKAKTKAMSLAKVSGIHLGRLINVTENQATPEPIIRPLALEKSDATLQQPTQVTPGENTITTSVTLSYQTY